MHTQPADHDARHPYVEVRDLKKYFKVKKSQGTALLKAVDGVSLVVRKGETLSIVGESGCGKSTLGRCLARLLESSAGEIRFNQQDITGLKGHELRALRKKIQFIFQDPFSSMNPRMRVESILMEPLRNFNYARKDADRRIAELLKLVSLKPEALKKYPHEFSGGQRQRIVIARALALEPEFIVCDEPVSALDVSVQAQVINLLTDLQKSLGLTYIFISHDLSVVKHISHRVAVMYLGRVVETGTRDAIFNHPRHPYTQALIAAVPRFADVSGKADAQRLEGEIPSPMNPPSGCAFRTRCPMAQARCAQETPLLRTIEGEQQAACHFV
ncbi:dipeptide ABC transporter ATP-binding protein [Paralcaligenes sp. KSB-10]|uniref:ABC transporter ATP-binding protein n=1 Tax=Paralcaligenes sp. KSB-10 TaxID=2901142 RepID=UPI001E5ACFA3|nr:dipeptide ABC transporter ATP-binding protein [Paralcaligenes sp. KSB-10]UHL64087.1 dipeptide ABC transporter ATP-binding protein [Paralcaligenes sp. KSB-10]